MAASSVGVGGLWAAYGLFGLTIFCMVIVYLLVFLVYAVIRYCCPTERAYLLQLQRPQCSSGGTTYSPVVLSSQAYSGSNGSCVYAIRDQAEECNPTGEENVLLPHAPLNSSPSCYYYYYNPRVTLKRRATWRDRKEASATDQRPLLQPTGRSSRYHSLRCRRLFLFAHLALRVFYTFLFTFSVAVSLIFSLRPTTTSTNTIAVATTSPSSIPTTASDLPGFLDRLPLLSHPGVPTTNRIRVGGIEGPGAHPGAETSGAGHYLSPSLLRLQAETRWLEAIAEQQLRRQLTHVDHLKMACQHAMSVEITNAVHEMRQVVRETIASVWTRDYSQLGPTGGNLLGRTAHWIDGQVARQRQLLDQYRSQMEQRLDCRFTKTYRAYYELLENSYQSGWLLYAQRMLNTSDKLAGFGSHGPLTGQPMSGDVQWMTDRADVTRADQWRSEFTVQYTSAQQSSGLERKHVRLMNYLGLPQVEAVHLTPSQLLHDLKRVFLSNQMRSHLVPPDDLDKDVLSNTGDSPIHRYRDDARKWRTNVEPLVVGRTFVSTNDADYLVKPSDSGRIEVGKPMNWPSTAELTSLYRHLHGNQSGGEQRRDYSRPVATRHRPKLIALSMTQLRLVLLLLDCCLIVSRFQQTYRVLRDLWLGQSLFLDAGSLLLLQSSGQTQFRPEEERHFEVGNDARWPSSGEQAGRRDRSTWVKMLTATNPSAPVKQFCCQHSPKTANPTLRSTGSPVPCQAAEKVNESLFSDPRHSQAQSAGLLGVPRGDQLTPSPASGCGCYFRTASSLTPPARLRMPPPTVFIVDQHAGCLLGIRATCCRHNHYLSAVIVISLLLLLIGLLFHQEQIFTGRWTGRPALLQNGQARSIAARSPARQHPYVEAIRRQADRLSGEWMRNTRNREVAMRNRLINYTARFKHDLKFFSRQIMSEIAPLMQTTPSSGQPSFPAYDNTTDEGDSSSSEDLPIGFEPRNWRQSVGGQRWTSPDGLTLNSEILFHQQICHFRPDVANTGLDQVVASMTENVNSEWGQLRLPNFLWTTLLSQLVDNDWTNFEQARQLTATAITVGILMVTVVGVLDIGGWLLRLLFLNPLDCQPVSQQQHHHNPEEDQFGIPAERVTLVSTQPPPLIPWPVDSREQNSPPLLPPNTKSPQYANSKVLDKDRICSSVPVEPPAAYQMAALYLNSEMLVSSELGKHPFRFVQPPCKLMPVLLTQSPDQTGGDLGQRSQATPVGT